MTLANSLTQVVEIGAPMAALYLIRGANACYYGCNDWKMININSAVEYLTRTRTNFSISIPLNYPNSEISLSNNDLDIYINRPYHLGNMNLEDFFSEFDTKLCSRPDRYMNWRYFDQHHKFYKTKIYFKLPIKKLVHIFKPSWPKISINHNENQKYYAILLIIKIPWRNLNEFREPNITWNYINFKHIFVDFEQRIKELNDDKNYTALNNEESDILNKTGNNEEHFANNSTSHVLEDRIMNKKQYAENTRVRSRK